MKPKLNNLPANGEEEQPPGNNGSPKGESFLVAETNPLPLYPFYLDYVEKSNFQSLDNFYDQNGHRKLLKSLHFQVVSRIEECQQLWAEFSPKETLFDTWEFRLAFWKGYGYRPHFLLLKENGNNLAILPLWYEEDEKRYTWFGSTWQEENLFLTKDPIFIPLLLAVAPSPLLLNAIDAKEVFWAREFVDFKVDDPKYILDLEEIGSSEGFLASLKKKKRYNLRRDRKIIESQKPEIIFNNYSHLDELVRLSKKRFYEKDEDTDWDDPRRVETFRQVVKLGQEEKSYQIRMLTIKIGSQIAGVDLIALYNGCYAPLKCGYDIADFPGLGNFVNLLEIDDAAALGMKKIDFLEINYGWKDRWFREVPLFQYEKK